MCTNYTLDCALKYAKRGWAVFPCKPGGKAPLTQNGFKDASRDPKQIKRWWRKWPEANIGIATGALSGLVVVDVDVKNGKGGFESYEQLGLPKRTTSVETPSGGAHFYFKVDSKHSISCRTNLRPGVDIRGNGGYVVVPPSTTVSGGYSWAQTGDLLRCPPELLHACKMPSKSQPVGDVKHDSTTIPIGSRNDTIFRAACGLRSRGHSFAVVSHRSAELNRLCEEPVTEDELSRIVKSAMSYEIKSLNSQAIIEIADAKCEFFLSEGKACASVDSEKRIQTYLLESRMFEDWLADQVYESTQLGPAPKQIAAALPTLRGRARASGIHHKVALRIDRSRNGYYIDLGSDDWRAARVSSSGWKVVRPKRVKFVRTIETGVIPRPKSPGDIHLLRDFLNVEEEHFPLIVAFMLECLRPETPYPLLELVGEQGTAKSTTQEFVKRLIDPSRGSLRAYPRNDRDFVVACGNSHLLSFNNMSHLTAEQQDLLCQVSTGGAASRRELYTDSEEILTSLNGPVMLNGINSVVSNQDLVSRTITLELPELGDNYVGVSELRSEFEQAIPEILGGLLDILSDALCLIEGGTRSSSRHRLADFVQLGTAVCESQGWESFEELFERNQVASRNRALEGSPTISALITFVQENKSYEGTFKTLMRHLYESSHSGSTLVRSAKALAGEIRRHRFALEENGIHIEHKGRSAKGNVVRLEFSM